MAVTDEPRSGAHTTDRSIAAPNHADRPLTRRRTVDLVRVAHGICHA
ncbi:hypothetical protein [Nocardia nova]